MGLVCKANPAYNMAEVSWDNLTVGQFLDLYRLSITADLDEMEKVERAVAIIYNKSEREVEEMKMGEFTQLSKQAAQFLTTAIPGKPVRSIVVGNNKYKITYDPTQLRQRQYVEVLHYGESPVENMHLIMASIVRPVKWGIARRNNVDDHAKIANDILQAPVKDVYHTCVFFCKLYMNLIESIRASLVNQIQEKTKLSKETADQLVSISLKGMGGFIQQPVSQNTKE